MKKYAIIYLRLCCCSVTLTQVNPTQKVAGQVEKWEGGNFLWLRTHDNLKPYQAGVSRKSWF